jgi:protein MpaA
MDARWLVILLFSFSGACAVKKGAVVESPRVYSAERTIELGRSLEDRPIQAHVLGSGDDVTLVLAAIHGNEPTSFTVADELLNELRERPELLSGHCVAIMPVANPDGLARKLRTNKSLVDLNRNFPSNNWSRTRKGIYFGGNEPASELETLAVMRAFEELKPARVISIHSMDKPCNNYDGPARALAEEMSRANGYPVKDNIGYPTPGSLGSWAGIDRQIPIITLELPRKLDGQKAWETNREALLAVIRSENAFAETDQD